MTWIKICGVTTVEDAEQVVSAGADAIGLNFVPGSKRRISLETARHIVRAVEGRVELIAVVADPDARLVQELRAGLGVQWLQLHGAEDPARTAGLLPGAFKAVAIGSAQDALDAARFPGERLLVDTKVAGASGGTGQVFDWQLARELNAERQLILAGGLTPENVGDAIRQLRPYGVDVASGVEHSPGRKSAERVAAFVHAAREAG